MTVSFSIGTLDLSVRGYLFEMIDRAYLVWRRIGYIFHEIIFHRAGQDYILAQGMAGRWVGGWADGWADGWVERMGGWADGWVGGWVGGNGWVGGRMGGWAVGCGARMPDVEIQP